ncbi:MAG: tetratricopeptide repeat protein [Acidiferrobacter sp.]
MDTITEHIDKACELIERDPKRAYRDLLALANEGSYEGMLLVGRCHLEGVGTLKDLDQAEKWLRRSHEKGVAQSAYFLAQVYRGRQDYQKERAILAAGAAAGDGPSAQALEQLEAWWHADGEPDMARLKHAQDILESEPRVAFEEFQVLAQEGSLHSLVYLGWAYYRGLGTAKDDAKAEALWHQALEQGPQSVQNEAINALGGYYLGRNEYSQALRYFQIGASKSDIPALYHLGYMYKNGLGIDRSYQQAETLWGQAIAQGHLLAKRELALLLISGRLGVRRMREGWALFFSGTREIAKICSDNPKSWRLRG